MRTGAIEWEDGARGTINAAGKALEYLCIGAARADAPTIVMLHEGLGAVALWRDFPARVAAATGCGVFVYSRAGYGQSDPADLPRPIDYMTGEALDVLPVLLDGIGVKQCILLGHSDGATISAIYAGSTTDYRVRGLVLMAPHFFTEPLGLSAIRDAKAAFDQGDLRGKLAKYHRDPDNAFRGWNDSWLNPDFAAWNVTDVIDHIRVPILAIQGEGDQYGSLAQIEEIEIRSYAPVEVALLADCKHAPFLEQPQKTLDLVAEFVARLQRIEATVVNTS